MQHWHHGTLLILELSILQQSVGYKGRKTLAGSRLEAFHAVQCSKLSIFRRDLHLILGMVEVFESILSLSEGMIASHLAIMCTVEPSVDLYIAQTSPPTPFLSIPETEGISEDATPDKYERFLQVFYLSRW